MDMNLLDLYNADRNWWLWHPDVAWVEDIVAMEWWVDKLLWKDEWQDNWQEDKKENWNNKTEATNEDKIEETNVENTESTEEKSKENEELEQTPTNEESIDKWEEKYKISESNNSDTESSEEIEDWVDLDDIMKKVDEEDINLELVKELEKNQQQMKNLEAKYEVVKAELEKAREKLAALDVQDSDTLLPPRVRWIVRTYEIYDNTWDEKKKSELISLLSWLLTELSWKDVNAFISKGWSAKDLANLESNTWTTPKSSAIKIDYDEEWKLDPNIIKEFWLDAM